MSEFEAVGLRYLTVHVVDADQEMEGIVARGGRIAREAADSGANGRHGFVEDPDGNWFEVSAPALTSKRESRVAVNRLGAVALAP